MIQSLIHRLLKRRHFWRYATFDEVAELYASRMMRMLAQYMISLFVALYLYQHDYSILFIACYFALSFAFRALISYPAARFVARFGPKHGILVGNLLYIPALIAFTLVPHYGVLAIVIFGIFQSLSMNIYDLSYLVDFSKVKHVLHAGKEIGYMQIFERLTASLSPLIGGLVAFLIAPEATMWLSAVLFAVASLPLLRTNEQTRLNQRLEFRGFPWRATWHSIVAETAVGFDTAASNAVWVLFLAVVVFTGSGSDVYLKIGAFASITALTSFIAAYSFGRIIDWRRGSDLLRIAAIANAATHLFRPFVATPAGVAAANITNEIATTGYSMAFMRGMFDTADNSGHRIVYLFCIEVALNLGAMLACLILAVLVLLLPTVTLAMQLFFVVTGLYVLLLLGARFNLYRS
jgi:MFS family permease